MPEIVAWKKEMESLQPSGGERSLHNMYLQRSVTVPSRCQKEGRMFTDSPLSMPFLLPSGLPARKGQQQP